MHVASHPSAIAASLDEAGIYVMEYRTDRTVLDAGTGAVRRTIDLRPYANAPMGASPNALVVSPDGSTVYVTNAGDNDVSRSWASPFRASRAPS